MSGPTSHYRSSPLLDRQRAAELERITRPVRHGDAPPREPESPRGYCDHCRRRGFMGRLLYMGNQQWACIDCFQYLTGTDARDPAVDLSAVSAIDRRPIVAGVEGSGVGLIGAPGPLAGRGKLWFRRNAAVLLALGTVLLGIAVWLIVWLPQVH